MDRVYQGSLALRILVMSVVLFAVPLFIYFFVAAHQDRKEQIHKVILRLENEAEGSAYLLAARIDRSFKTLDLIEASIQTSSQELDNESLEKTAASLLGIVITGQSDGQSWRVSRAFDPTLIGEKVEVAIKQEVLRGERFSHLGSFSPFGKGLWVVQGTSVDKFIAVFYPIEPLIDSLLATLSNRDFVDIALLDRSHGFFIDGQSVRLAYELEEELLSGKQPVVQSVEDGYKAEPLKKKRAAPLGLEITVPDTDLSLVLQVNKKLITALRSNYILYILSTFFLVFVMGGSVALWISRRMSVPFRTLKTAMDRVSQGDLTARYSEDKMGFELNILGNLFNQTVDSLCENMAVVERERMQKEGLHHELAIGQKIQLNLLPHKKLAFPGSKVAAFYLPAKHVGGDFYDIFLREHGSEQDLVLAVADASGKGISACLYSLVLRSLFRSFSTAYSSVSKIMLESNNLFCEDTGVTGMFVTAFVAIYCPKRRTLSYCSCGHNPAFVLRANGMVERLESHEMALGILPFDKLIEKKVQLESGDKVVFYTDGITEAHDEGGKLYGEERFLQSLMKRPSSSAVELVQEIELELELFRKQAPQFDDITMMVVEIT